jgi:hypothetical protein
VIRKYSKRVLHGLARRPVASWVVYLSRRVPKLKTRIIAFAVLAFQLGVAIWQIATGHSVLLWGWIAAGAFAWMGDILAGRWSLVHKTLPQIHEAFAVGQVRPLPPISIWMRRVAAFIALASVLYALAA